MCPRGSKDVWNLGQCLQLQLLGELLRLHPILDCAFETDVCDGVAVTPRGPQFKFLTFLVTNTESFSDFTSFD